VDAARAAFLKGTEPSKIETRRWTTHEWLHFYAKCQARFQLQQMKSLDDAFHFTKRE